MRTDLVLHLFLVYNTTSLQSRSIRMIYPDYEEDVKSTPELASPVCLLFPKGNACS
jgi:hypothetical protein